MDMDGCGWVEMDADGCDRVYADGGTQNKAKYVQMSAYDNI